VTDAHGMFHFDGVPAGVHVVQLDLDTVPEAYEVTLCEGDDRFAGRAFSQFVDLAPGTIWRTDFRLVPRPGLRGEVSLELTSRIAGDRVAYGAVMESGAVPLADLRLTVMLPEGAAYVPGTSRLGGVGAPDPEIAYNALTYRLGDAPGGWQGALTFKAAVDAAKVPVTIVEGTGAVRRRPTELVTRAVLIFDAPAGDDLRTPVVTNALSLAVEDERLRRPDLVLRPRFETRSASVTEEDRESLDRAADELAEYDIIHLYVVGHTDSVRIAPRNTHIYADNTALSLARAESVARHLSDALGLAPSDITVEGRGESEPVAPNATAEGRALNRRVEVRVLSDRVGMIQTVSVAKGRDGTTLEVVGARRGEQLADAGTAGSVAGAGYGAAAAAAAVEGDGADGSDGPDGAPVFDGAWLADASPGFEWLWPPDGHGPAIPSVRISIKHDPGDDIELALDGTEVNPRNFSETIVSDDGTIAVSTWTGVDLVEGDNLLEAVATDGSGRVERIERTLHYAGSPVQAELNLGESWLVADGTNAPVVAVRLTDKDGFPAREGVIGGLSIDPPYESLETLEALAEYPLSGIGSRQPTYVVDEDGIAYVELAPTTRAGEAVLRFRLVNGEHEIRAWLEPAVSDWILVGLAEGTLGYETVQQNAEDLDGTGEASDYYDDGRIAFFARGRIQGQWLLTVALDTAKDEEEVRRRLFQTIDPDAYYTLYGDATWQGYAAASSDRVYVKLERSKFYALYGDYVTGLTVTDLSRYSRTMTGAKTELSMEHVALNAFASETDQAFVKDEIRGDGTSGLYQLTRRNLVLNSEKVSIQTRDRYHSEVIVAERHLIRHIDYDIDYDLGTLFFKEPVPSQDQEFNPNWIVVDYESYDSTDGAWNYGGRAALRTRGRTAEVGGTYIHEGVVGRESDLVGADATVWLGRETELRGEYATTTTELPSETVEGEAYLAELVHRSGRADGRLYFREQGLGFGLGQQNATETATRKLGLDATGRFGAGFSGDVVAYRQTNLITEAERDVGEGRVGYGSGPYTLRAGYRYAVDRFADDTEKRSEQVTAGASARIADSRLTLRADHAQSLKGKNANPAYPTRTVLGADFKVADPITVFGEHEMLSGEAYDAQTSRVGIKASPWRGAQVSSAYQQRLTENAARSFATLGLRQSWQVHERWSVDAGVDHARTIEGSESRPVEGGLIPPTLAQPDFTAVSAGLAFRAPTWGWTTRGEYRTSDASEKWTGAAGIYGEPTRGLGLSAHALVFRNEGVALGHVTRGDVRLGLVYRPEASRWTILDRLDLIGEEVGVVAAGSTSTDGWRIVNNLHVNYRATRRFQVGAQYGAKYVQQDLGTDRLQGYTDLGGLELRYDLTPRWDVGLAASVRRSRDLGTYDYRTGASIGWNAFTNAWISAGYNFTGFEDEDFSEAGFTAQGPFVRFRLKFDQMSIREPGVAARGIDASPKAGAPVGEETDAQSTAAQAREEQTPDELPETVGRPDASSAGETDGPATPDDGGPDGTDRMAGSLGARSDELGAGGGPVAGTGGPFQVVATSVVTEDGAWEEAVKLLEAGYSVDVERADLGEKGVWHRVIVEGGFPTFKKAREVVSLLAGSGCDGAWISMSRTDG